MECTTAGLTCWLTGSYSAITTAPAISKGALVVIAHLPPEQLRIPLNVRNGSLHNKT